MTALSLMWTTYIEGGMEVCKDVENSFVDMNGTIFFLHCDVLEHI